MLVQVKLFATLRKYLPADAKNKTATVALVEGQTVGDALTRLGVPLQEAHLILVNGQNRSADHPLSADDVISVFPPVAGG
jgi:molybdopterin converting factor small subunit